MILLTLGGITNSYESEVLCNLIISYAFYGFVCACVCQDLPLPFGVHKKPFVFVQATIFLSVMPWPRVWELCGLHRKLISVFLLCCMEKITYFMTKNQKHSYAASQLQVWCEEQFISQVSALNFWRLNTQHGTAELLLII